jgi:periplasmic protein TonB
MFDVLVASGTHLELRSRWVGTSLVVHASAAVLAVMATRAALESPSVAIPDTPVMLFVAKAPPEPPPPEVKPESPVPAVVVTEPPPKGFQTVVALTDIPDAVPPVDLTQRTLDPRDFTGRDVEGGLAAGVVGGTGKADVWAGGLAADAIYEATTNDERFSPATVVSQPAPRYPKHLEAAGLQGRVLVEFVIDATGHVEPGSVRSLESTHPAFEAAAQKAMLGSLFKPARWSGHPVRQLTRQSVRFVSAATP